jgi:phospholipase/carboxylesterase
MMPRRISYLAAIACLLIALACHASPPAPLSFVERRPSKDAPSESLPLAIGIHGLGDTPEHFALGFEDIQAPARMLFPRGPDEWREGYSWFPIQTLVPTPGLSVRMDEEALAKGVRASGDRLARLLQEQLPAGKRAVVFGFSQGAIQSYDLAVRHPELVFAAIPVSGLLPKPLWPNKAGPNDPPIYAFHGEQDGIVPIAGARAIVEHLRSLGRQASLREVPDAEHALPAAVWREVHSRIEAALREAAAQ